MVKSFGALASLVALGLMVPGLASAQEQNKLLVVPFSAQNPELPHPAHEQARITLKGVIQNATCGSYQVWWDIDRDGNFDEEYRRDVSRNGTTLNVRDIGRTFLVPNVNRDESYNINVRVRNTCDGNVNTRDKFGTYRIFIYDFTPSNDPQNWTQDQIDIMNLMSVQESLWWHHRELTGLSGNNSSTISGYPSYSLAAGIALWQFTINGRLPAYPPGRYNAYNQAVPNGWIQLNDYRWNNDPYAETAMRLTNYLGSGYRLANLNRTDEDNTCGYDANGNVRRCQRIVSANSQGLYSHTTNTYRTGMFLGAMSTVLPALAGTRLQVGGGGVPGMLWEHAIQEQTDYLGYQQIDSCGGKGGWIYGAIDGCASESSLDGSTSQWSYIGLESAEIAGGPYGVFVNNRHKYRLAPAIVTSQRGDWQAGYRARGNHGDMKLTGGALVAGRWLGMHTFQANDNGQPWPNEDGRSRATYKTHYDRYVTAIARDWTLPHVNNPSGHGWGDALWEFGDYLCGNRNAVYNGGRCGSTYAMYSLQKGFRTGQPELEVVGNHDWYREFSIYYNRAMYRNTPVANGTTGYSNFGKVEDAYCSGVSVTCRWGSGSLSAGMAGLVMTPSLFKPKPVSSFEPQPAVVTEGCAGGQNGVVTFDHSESFHPNANSRIIAYQYDVDTRNGLWWDTGANPDVQAAGNNPPESVEFRFLQTGNYTVTLRVVDNDGQTKTTTRAVTVNDAANVPPGAVHGGPYNLGAGSALQLNGSGTDGNLGCGDRITVAWDLDNDGQYDDANSGNAAVAWAQLQNLPRNRALPIRIRVTDAEGETATAETTLTIFPAEPVANGRANPNPAACEQQVTFDGNGSFHPNPARSIAAYEWDVDGRQGTDGAGAQFNFTYQSFGTYTVTLTVRDDLGATDSTQFDVEVNQGNGAPVARIAQANYVVLEGDELRLDARGSTDPNTACGDRIAGYAWDLDGDGAFDDANGTQPVIPWNQLAQIANFDAANAPIEITISLQVTDTFGRTATVDATVTLFSALPIATVSQRPDPAPINLITGFSNAELDGRESRSPIPGVTIVRYDWDLNDDGAFEVQDAAVTNLIKVFQPVPGPDNIEATFIRLRVTDSNGRQATQRFQVNYRVPPTPPTADADPTDPPEEGYHVLLGEGLTLDASQSLDPDTDEFGDFIEFYRWDLTYDANDGFDPDFEVQDANGDLEEQQLDITPQQLAAAGIDQPGEYTIRLQVEDTTELTNEDNAPLFVYPRNPIARAIADPDPAGCDQRVTLNGSTSSHGHPEIDVVAWQWDLDNDGDYDDAQGEIVATRFDQFSFGQPHTVGLRVTDTNGNSGTADIEVDVSAGNRAPSAVAGGTRDGDGAIIAPYVIAVGDPLDLNGLGSADPDVACGDRIVSYQWDVGNNGSFEANGEDPAPVAWATLQGQGINGAGVYQVRLRVTDRFGTTGDGIATLRVVNGPNAEAASDPNRANCEQVVTFDGRASSTDGQGPAFELVSYEWDFDGDGEFDDGEGQQVAVPAVGLPGGNGEIVMTGNLRITDASGRTDTDSTNVRIDVLNVAPIGDAGGPYATGPIAGGGFAPVQLDGRGSRDPNEPCDQLVVYKWDTDGDGRYGHDDNPNDLQGPQVNYTDPTWRVGTVDTVRLIVCDGAGACSNSNEAEIQILAVPPPTGEVVSPRSDDDICIGAGNFDLDLRIAHPAGLAVTATVSVAGRQVGQQVINTNANGNAVDATIPINANLVPEGRNVIEVTLTDPSGGTARINSGGRITFDRTPPVVQIGNQLREGVCYQDAQVPEPDINIQDALDPAPQTRQAIEADGCGRTLVVTAVDACGNEGVGERPYLLAQQVAVEIEGAEEGALVAPTRMSWDVVGAQECAANVTATLSRNGAGGQPYPENQLINQPGVYALTVRAENCAGIPRNIVRSFSVNGPPVAVPVPDGHQYADPNPPAGLNYAYRVAEGTGLQLDGSESLPPEAADEIVAYNWDLDNDGQFDDAQGETAAFPTDDDGVFRAALQAVDGIGATGTTVFQVAVIDVDPNVDSGGPYVVEQGNEFQFDASETEPGSAADPISRYVWSWGDGTPDTEGAMPNHTYQNEGVFNARLTVFDEDSSVTVDVRVEVRDVDPQVGGINPPDDLPEILPLTFTIDVEAGAPTDPITRIEWDFDNDNQADCVWSANGGVPAALDCTQNDGRTAITSYRDVGQKTVVVKVFDSDSVTIEAIAADVREITLGELVAYSGEQVEVALAGPGDPFAKRELVGYADAAADGTWGETHGWRGNTMIAIDKMLTKTTRAQAQRLDFGLENWAMARQMVREISRLRDSILDQDDGPGEDHRSMQRALGYIEDMEALFDSDDFEADAYSGDLNRIRKVHEVWQHAYEAYFWLRDSIDPCAADGFNLPANENPVDRVADANPVNDGLVTALEDLSAEMTEYANDGNGDAPGRAEVLEAIQVLNAIRPAVARPINIICPPGQDNCITDYDALEMEVRMMGMATDLDEAAIEGAYHRQWQSCLVEAVKFRIEVSILRVEFVCGQNSGVSQTARAAQAIGLEFYDEGRKNEALQYYKDDERKCLIINTYNECLHNALPAENPEYELPEECLEEVNE